MIQLVEDAGATAAASMNDGPFPDTNEGAPAAKAGSPKSPKAAKGGAVPSAVIKEMNSKIEALQELCFQVERDVGRKIDNDKMEERIDFKYGEIVKYLQVAIDAASSQEDQFQKLAEELQVTVKTLMATKADRTDLADIISQKKDELNMQNQIDALEQAIKSKSDKIDFTAADFSKLTHDQFVVAVDKIQHNLTALIMEQIEKVKEKSIHLPWLSHVPDDQSGPLICLSCNKKRSDGIHNRCDTNRPGSATMGGGFHVKPETASKIRSRPSTAGTRLPRFDQGDVVAWDEREGRRDPNRGLIVAHDGTVYPGGSSSSNQYGGSTPVYISTANKPFRDEQVQGQGQSQGKGRGKVSTTAPSLEGRPGSARTTVLVKTPRAHLASPSPLDRYSLTPSPLDREALSLSLDSV